MVYKYRNLWDENFQKKLDIVRQDVLTGKIDRLTNNMGRDRYHVSDYNLRRIQVQLAREGLLTRFKELYNGLYVSTAFLEIFELERLIIELKRHARKDHRRLERHTIRRNRRRYEQKNNTRAGA